MGVEQGIKEIANSASAIVPAGPDAVFRTLTDMYALGRNDLQKSTHQRLRSLSRPTREP
jgi:hypothetical protein